MNVREVKVRLGFLSFDLQAPFAPKCWSCQRCIFSGGYTTGSASKGKIPEALAASCSCVLLSLFDSSGESYTKNFSIIRKTAGTGAWRASEPRVGIPMKIYLLSCQAALESAALARWCQIDEVGMTCAVEAVKYRQCGHVDSWEQVCKLCNIIQIVSAQNIWQSWRYILNNSHVLPRYSRIWEFEAFASTAVASDGRSWRRVSTFVDVYGEHQVANWNKQNLEDFLG